jgi:flagellar biosynthesis protein FlhG
MSKQCASEWLLSQNKYSGSDDSEWEVNGSSPAGITISISSGKGGVGKTSVAVKLAKMMVAQGRRVLLIDCDYNLSNTLLKLNLPVSNNFFSLISAEKEFDECLYKDGGFHLLSGCNGNLELFDNGLEYDYLVIDIINQHRDKYDYVLLDCPAGISRSTLNLNAYSDYRFIVVTPDKSSVTDSYSLMKILSIRHKIKQNHLLLNKVSSARQYKRIVKSMSETVDNYLNCQLSLLGGIPLEREAVDLFDQILFSEGKNSLHQYFLKVLKRFDEEHSSRSSQPFLPGGQQTHDVDGMEHEVP